MEDTKPIFFGPLESAMWPPTIWKVVENKVNMEKATSTWTIPLLRSSWIRGSRAFHEYWYRELNNMTIRPIAMYLSLDTVVSSYHI
ncbi:MAG: hypothetical protein MPF33_01820 [Candidatus Aramenus sp.]|nr:hypothetical protein [Candidatus Aramenus sp.]